MQHDLLDLYSRAGEWAASNVAAAADQLDAPTPCDDWDTRTLLDHMLDTQRYFRDTARGEESPLPSPDPPSVLADDPVQQFTALHTEVLDAFGQPGVIEKTGPALGIAFSDQLIHGWDLAVATGRDTTMPGGLAEAAFDLIHGKFTDEQRTGMFAPEIQVPDGADPQSKLLAYVGRRPR